MKIVFLGTSEFAVPSLQKLRRKHEIAAVITKHDKPQGRRLVSSPSPIRIAANSLGLTSLSIEGLALAEAVSVMGSYGADLFVVIAYGQILSARILALPKMFSIGLHASILPKYRGPSPINWAILNGEERTGVTVFRLNDKMDAGEMISQGVADILSSDNARTLSTRLADLGADLLVETVDAIAAGSAEFTEQDAKDATFTQKLKKEDGRIDWIQPAAEIHNRIRGLYGWPGAFSALSGKTVKIWSSELTETPGGQPQEPGRIAAIEKNGITVSCGKDAVIIVELQAQGGKRMKAPEYAIGHKVRLGDRFVK
jgi:methionyl-tRNA formyltransferase